MGATQAGLLKRAVGGGRVVDLLFHLPTGYVDRRERPVLRDAIPGRIVTLTLDIVRHEPPAAQRQPWRAIGADGTGQLDLVFFRRGPWAQRLPVGARLLVSGRLELRGGRLSMAHPDHTVPVERAGLLPGIEPVWRLTGGLQPWQILRAMGHAVAMLPDLPEWHDAALLKQRQWPAFGVALRAIQAPVEWPDEAARQRLAYDELLAGQVATLQFRGRERSRPGRALTGDGSLRRAALDAFGHSLTDSQVMALEEIDADLAAPRRMLRLLQGDVGSGKTLVGILAMLRAVEAGGQAALMVPTEILAAQHFRTMTALTGVPAAMLSGSVKGAARKQVLAGLADGSIKLAVGTHALFQRTVKFADLALAVIDEQHRFGVDQRLMLGAKGPLSDLLVMTATPIPRTLLLTQWGEMAVSRLTGKPAGRLPIRTTLHSLAALDGVVAAVGRALEAGARAYWVCPVVAESETSDIAAAEERFAALRQRFGELVGLAHGQLQPEERDSAMADFAAGRTCLLVATTVVEVGMDVREASVMVIEHADRFGLAQLHQLRGRVGRGDRPSYCLLLHDPVLSQTARRRLMLLRDTEDGFLIADEDFRLRGAGEALGTKQSGLPDLRLADPVEDEDLLKVAHRDAEVLLNRDPGLESERGRAIRLLLDLFDRAEPARTLLAG